MYLSDECEDEFPGCLFISCNSNMAESLCPKKCKLCKEDKELPKPKIVYGKGIIITPYNKA